MHGFESQLILSSSLTFICNESFSFTSFSKVIYNGINEPKCEGTIGFPSEQIIYVKKEYKSTKFCEYDSTEEPTKTIPTEEPTKTIPTEEPSQKPTDFTEIPTDIPSSDPSKDKKISAGVIIGIVICCVILIIAIVLMIILIMRKRILRQPLVNPSILLDDSIN